MGAQDTPKGIPPHLPNDSDHCCDSGQSCKVKVPLDDKCCNVDEIKEQIKLLVIHLITTVTTELDTFDLEIIELLDKLKCPDKVEVEVCIKKVKCTDKDKCKDDDDDDDQGEDDDDQ